MISEGTKKEDETQHFYFQAGLTAAIYSIDARKEDKTQEQSTLNWTTVSGRTAPTKQKELEGIAKTWEGGEGNYKDM